MSTCLFPESGGGGGSGTWVALAAGGAAILLLVVVAVLACYCRRRAPSRRTHLHCKDINILYVTTYFVRTNRISFPFLVFLVISYLHPEFKISMCSSFVWALQGQLFSSERLSYMKIIILLISLVYRKKYIKRY